MALSKKNRLNLRLHRQRVESDCQKLHSPLFTYLIAKKPAADKEKLISRFAVLLSKKLAKLAVVRNKTKRKITESIQNSLSVLPQNIDVILIPKKEILTKTIIEVSKDLTQNLKQK